MREVYQKTKNWRRMYLFVLVNDEGVDDEGQTYTARADPADLIHERVIEEPVILQKPDGSRSMGTRIMPWPEIAA